jgi:hypothetical protein
MKKQTLLIASLCWGIALVMVPAVAQAGGVQARVPFNFDVSGKTLPAGEYTMITGLHQVTIRDARGWAVATVLTNDLPGQFAREGTKVVFRCYDERCFLVQVWSPAHDGRLEVPTSRAETGLANQAGHGEAGRSLEQITTQ